MKHPAKYRLIFVCYLLATLFTRTALGQSPHTVTIDTSRTIGRLPHFWTTLGLDHSGLLLETRDAWGDKLETQIVKAIADIGLSGIRQHGILHDDVGIYREINGEPVYDFRKADRILDTYHRLGLKPVIEFGGMPHDLASNPRATAFKWRQGISPPKSWMRWEDLIFHFVQHYTQRYGKEEIASWYFEVWNEPDMAKFWRGTQAEYFKLYDYTVAGAKRANPDIRIGGPSPSGPHQITQNSKLGERFLDYLLTTPSPLPQSRLDFFSIHTWNFLDANTNGYFQTVDFLATRNLNLPILVTEAGPTWQFNLDPQPHDTVHGAAFIVETLARLIAGAQLNHKPLPELWVWWVLSDLFEEGSYRESDPFIGCMGLMTREGIEKPTYVVYRLLHRMGHALLSLQSQQTGPIHGFATRNQGDAIQVILSHGKNPGHGPSDNRYYEDSAIPERIKISLLGLDPKKSHTVTIQQVDHQHGDAFTAWTNMGRPARAHMGEQDWQRLRDAMRLPVAQTLRLNPGTDSLELAMPSPGVSFLEIVADSAML